MVVGSNIIRRIRPANTTHRPNFVPMLGQRRCVVFAARATISYGIYIISDYMSMASLGRRDKM